MARKAERLSDERRSSGPTHSFWREPLSNSAAGLEGERGRGWQWVAVDPIGNRHTLGQEITEHSDGTITTHTHLADLRPTQHLGWLIKRGVWVDAGGSPRKPITSYEMPPGEVELRRAIGEERMRIGSEPPPPPKIEPVKRER